LSALIFCCALNAGTLLAQSADPRPRTWLTGGPLQAALEIQGRASWSRAPLRSSFERLARTYRVCVILDRRLDPDALLDYDARDQSLEVTLKGIAARMNIGCTFLEPVVYFGPPETAAKLRTLALLRQDELAKLPPAAQRPWRTVKPLAWAELTAPRAVFAELARECQVKLANPEALPHDLLAACDTSPLNGAERWTVVAAQFDLTWRFESDGRTVTLLPIPQHVVIVREYAWRKPAELAAKLKQLGIAAELTVSGEKLAFAGTAEEHQLAADFIRGKQVKTSAVIAGEKRYSLKVNLPLRKLLAELIPKLGLEVEYDEAAIQAAGLSLDQDVQVTVQEVTVKQLLTAALEPAGLTFAQVEKTIIVKPAAK